MFLVGLSGGIAAGKSTIARRLQQHGARVIDADDIARAVVEPGTPGLEQIRSRFGDDVIDNGVLDRAALAAKVFGHPESLAALNAIVHPLVRQESARRFAEAGDDEIVVYDIPLLAETNGQYQFDFILIASAADQIRRERLVELRGYSADEADRRIGAQADEDARRALADFVIDTGGDLASTISQTDAAWDAIVHSEQANSSRRERHDRDSRSS